MRETADYGGIETSSVSSHVGPYGRKPLGTYGGRTDGGFSFQILRGRSSLMCYSLGVARRRFVDLLFVVQAELNCCPSLKLLWYSLSRFIFSLWDIKRSRDAVCMNLGVSLSPNVSQKIAL